MMNIAEVHSLKVKWNKKFKVPTYAKRVGLDPGMVYVISPSRLAFVQDENKTLQTYISIPGLQLNQYFPLSRFVLAK